MRKGFILLKFKLITKKELYLFYKNKTYDVMRSQKIILIVLFAMFILGSCKYECPCFDTSLLVWMPQEYGDSIQFTNQDNSDKLTFIVTKKYYSDS